MHDADFLGEPKSLFQIGRALGRVVRYAGNAPLFYSVFQHCLVVALLLPIPLRAHGLLHDVSEAWTSDISSLFKRENFRVMEQALLERVYQDQRLALPTAAEHEILKIADNRALLGEVWTGAGTQRLQQQYQTRDQEAENLTKQAMDDWPPQRLVTTNDAGFEFDRLFQEYKKQ